MNDVTPPLASHGESDALAFLSGGGEVASLMRAMDWSKTPLGPMAGWPQSLRTAVAILLRSPVPIVLLWGEDGVMIYNDAYSVFAGARHPQLLGSKVREGWAEIADFNDHVMKAGLAGKRLAYRDQHLVLYRHGVAEDVWMNLDYSPVPDESGRPAGVLAIVSETTERVIGERRLRTLRELGLRTAGADSVEAVCRAAVDALAAANRADLPFALMYRIDGERRARLVAGHGVEPATGRAEVDLGSGDEALAPLVAACARRAPAEGRTAPWLGAAPAPDRLVALPIVSGDDVAALLVVGADPFLASRPGYRDFLDLVAAQIARAATSALALEEERRRAEALAELDRAKTGFFANVSHEFRTPLTLMLGPLEEMLGRPQASCDPGDRALLEAAHRNGLRLLKLVNSLLDFSRIEAGRAQASYEPTDLAAFTADLASNFRSLCERAGLRLVVDCPPLPAPVHVDREMWEKIVLNLVSNAFKFTFEGEIAIGLETRADAAVLTVRDTGTGIPAHELPRLFERFHRIEGARGRSFEGSGIGLALVQELVRLHGGEIDATSQEGQGSAFAVSIPFGTAHLPRERLRPARALAPTAIRAHAYVEEARRWLPDAAGSAAAQSVADSLADILAHAGAERARVLLADDNADMRDYVRRLLGARYEVEAVADGEAALAAARRRRPDLVLTDAMMPGLDGFGLLRALRGDPALKDVPVVVLSARAGEEARVEGMEEGADDYLTKPFSARELSARIDGHLALARTRREREAAVRRRAEQLQALASASLTIAAAPTLQAKLDAVAQAARTIVGARRSAVSLAPSDPLLQAEGFAPDARGEHDAVRADAGAYALAGAVDGPAHPPRDAASGGTGASDALAGAAAMPAGASGMPGADEAPGLGAIAESDWLAAPLLASDGRTLGFVRLAEKTGGGAFDAEDRAILVQLARFASNAIEQAQADAALRELNETLEARVRQAVAERASAEEQLRHAQKMEAIGHLTGGIAHDFNNLLTVVIGNIESIQRHLGAGAPERLRRSAENAMQGALRAATLTQRLLAFSRRQPLEPRPTDLNRLVSGMSELLRRTLGEGIQVRTLLGDGLWPVEIDPNQLESALLNLAINARDAMPDGGRLTIATANAVLDAPGAGEADARPGRYVVVAVSDTGVGMPKHVSERAFEPFFTTKPTGHGTGLGLSQVYGFVKQSGGHVSLCSEPGAGTTIEIYLPCFCGDAEQEPSPAAAPEPRKATVLVVEDNDGVRDFSAETLRELGYRVIEARDGPMAMRQLELYGGSIDLLFTDVGLPGMNGVELAEEARRRLPGLKVLFTTGYGGDAIVRDGRLIAGIEMIGKPFTYAELAAKVHAIVAGEGGHG
ncbi:ATP-binding protein [Vulcaniibacterium tengchongense]|uniref:histidine kinase n=1 Tax=Vulcaniibacterium tengchongense TaxID=1273429 RepID=A0A3N4VQF4_9GAMM|nr:ATP-binding protein [Vulcaniibacterium tengchongense]RPE81431.1 PAS domain S-box-containing protein [Vulcaniibacterium tengchongense]